MTGPHNLRPSRHQVRKLRESCTSCAHSKIRCTKEKPICARCTERNLPCHYTESKRMGRNPRLPSPNSLGTIGLNQKYESRGGSSTKSGYERKYPDQQGDSYSQSCKPSPSEYVPSSISLATDSNLKSKSTAAMKISGTETMTTNVWSDFSLGLSTEVAISSPNIDDFDGQFSPFPKVPDQVFNGGTMNWGEPLTGMVPTSLQGAEISSTFINLQLTPSFSEVTFLDSPRCCCLSVALQTLTTLLSDASDGCCRPLETENGSGSNNFMPTHPIDKLIMDNKRAMEIVQEILACVCSRDEYVVSIIALISCKVLSWYSIAGAATLYEHETTYLNENLPHSHTGVDLHGFNKQDQRRTAAQQVLSELYRAQFVIDSLATQLEELHGGSQGLPGVTRLGEDLRQRAQAVSSQLIGILHQ